jgi:hypothetical protein
VKDGTNPRGEPSRICGPQTPAATRTRPARRRVRALTRASWHGEQRWSDGGFVRVSGAPGRPPGREDRPLPPGEPYYLGATLRALPRLTVSREGPATSGRAGPGGPILPWARSRVRSSSFRVTSCEKSAKRKPLIRKYRVAPVGTNWRKRMGVEPTRRPSRSEHAGFEDQEGHRAPCASGADSKGTRPHLLV